MNFMYEYLHFTQVKIFVNTESEMQQVTMLTGKYLRFRKTHKSRIRVLEGPMIKLTKTSLESILSKKQGFL